MTAAAMAAASRLCFVSLETRYSPTLCLITWSEISMRRTSVGLTRPCWCEPLTRLWRSAISRAASSSSCASENRSCTQQDYTFRISGYV